MTPPPRARRVLTCCALVAGSTTALVAGPATAQPDTTTPNPTRERLNVRVGQAALVTGRAAAGRAVVLQRRGHHGWRTLDRATADATGGFRLRHRPARASSAQVASASPAPPRPRGCWAA